MQTTFLIVAKKTHFFIDIICTHLPLLKAMRCNFSCTKGSKGRCNRRFPLCLNRVLYKLLKMLKIADNPIFSPKMHFSICKTSRGKFTLIKSYDRKTYHQERSKTFLPEKFKWAPFFNFFHHFLLVCKNVTVSWSACQNQVTRWVTGATVTTVNWANIKLIKLTTSMFYTMTAIFQ